MAKEHIKKLEEVLAEKTRELNLKIREKEILDKKGNEVTIDIVGLNAVVNFINERLGTNKAE